MFLIQICRDVLLAVKQLKMLWKMRWMLKKRGLKQHLKKEFQFMRLIVWMIILDNSN